MLMSHAFIVTESQNQKRDIPSQAYYTRLTVNPLVRKRKSKQKINESPPKKLKKTNKLNYF